MTLSILIATIVAFVVGMIWYSPIMFGKIWMKINNAEHLTEKEIKAMQKKMMPMYMLQILLSLLTMWILYMNIVYFGKENAVAFAFFMWLGYIMPTQAGAVIWGSTREGYRLKQFLIMTSYQLVIMIIAGYIFSMF